ncbi:MAG: penicillin-binding protein 1C [bacterium]
MSSARLHFSRLLPVLPLLAFALLALSLYLPIPASRLDSSEVESMRLVDRHGHLLREVLSTAAGRSQWVRLEQISPWVARCLINTEDRRFYLHRGLDPFALLRAAYQNFSNRRIISGGSTLNQQLIRQIYDLPPQPLGKLVEMWLALRLDRSESKLEILEQYLNRVPFGNQAHGIATASQIYFGKPAAHLTLAESAFLAGLPQAPSAYNPLRRFQRARGRQKRVLEGMWRRGVIDSLQFAAALNESLHVASRPKDFLAPHACDLALELMKAAPSPATKTVRLTLAAPLQNEVEKTLSNNLKLLARANVTNGAALVIDNHTGDILAWAGSVDYFDEEHQGQVNGVLAPRQPGSALKPFTYGIALERDYTAASVLPDIQTKATVVAGGDFTPTNYDGRFHGPVRLRAALACSYNVPVVRVLETFGAELLWQRLRRAGFASLKKNAQHYGLGLTLGNGEVSLLELARGFLALQNNGVVKNLHLFADHNFPAIAPVPPERVFSSEISFLLGDILRDDAARKPAFGEGSVLDLPFPCAVKTGTTKDFRDNWTVGFTSAYTVGVWVGNFDGAAMNKISGVSGAGPIFREIMMILHRDLQPFPVSRPPTLQNVSICTYSGLLPNQFCPNQMTELFLRGTQPAGRCDWHRILAVPRAGAVAPIAARALQVEPRLALFLPSLYQSWAAAEGIRQPLLLSTVEMPGHFEGAALGDAKTEPVGEFLRITFPDEGDIFKIDPVLRLEFQTLLLECVAAEGIPSVTWLVDNVPLATVAAPFHARWQLRKGEHSVQVKAGNAVRSWTSVPRRFLVL